MSGARLLSRDMTRIAAGPQTFTYLPPRLFHQQPYPPKQMGEVEVEEACPHHYLVEGTAGVEGEEACPHHYLVEGTARIRLHCPARHLG